MSQLQVTGEAKIRDIQGPVIANSGVITALDGAASQYVRGDGTLADFPTSTGGGSSVSYYLNSSVSQGTIGGVAYRELSKEPIIGAGTDITISANGYVASYITDANDPDVLSVPGGNFNCEFYFSVNNNTGNPTTYAELYKYDGTTFTLLGSSVAVPESLNQGTTIAPYYFAIPVATAALALTDRLAIRIYVSVDGRVVTLHTENSHLCQVVTTFSKGMVSLNNLTDQSQFLATGTSGTNFNIVSSGDTHTFNIPSASATNRGLITTGNQTIAGNKIFTAGVNVDNLQVVNSTLLNHQAGLSPTLVGTTAIGGSANGLFFNVNDNGRIQEFIFDTTGDRDYTFPAASGTLALTSNLSAYVPYTGATGNVDLGLFGLTSNAVKAIGDNSTYGGVISIKQNNVIGGLIGTGYTELFGKTNRLGISFGAGSIAYLSNSVLTAERTYTLPDLSGTFAMLEAGTQTFTGTVNVLGSLGTKFGISIEKGNTPSPLSANDIFIYASSGATNIVNFANSSYNATLSFPTSNQTYTFPAATGTIALTSNLSSYVPYSGATGNVDLGSNYIISSSIVFWKGTGSGLGNIGIGRIVPLGQNTTGQVNIGIGENSLFFNTTGSNNIALGGSANGNNTTGSGNIGIGSSANLSNTTGSNNIAIGINALRNNTVDNNVAIGHQSLLTNTTGSTNTAIGYGALQLNTTGLSNTAIGHAALNYNTTSSWNTAVGVSALGLSTGGQNTAIGYAALGNNTTGVFNIAIGYTTGASIVTGNYNTIIGNYAGTSAMSNNIVLADGAGNIRYQWNGTNNVFGNPLSGTSATFSSSMFVNSPLNNTVITTSDATNITNGFNLLASSSYWGIRTSTNGNFNLDVFGAGVPKNALIIAQSTGAATFSSSVTAASGVIESGGFNIKGTGGVAKPDMLRLSNASAGGYYWDIWRDNTTGYLNFGAATGGSVSTFLTIKDVTGNVGIGTSSPTALLHLAVANASVDGTKGVKITNPAGTSVMLECGVSSDSFVGTTSASAFSIRTANSPIITISSGGNVSIGSTVDAGFRTFIKGANGVLISAGSSSSNNALFVQNEAENTTYFIVRGDGNIRMNNSVFGNTTSGTTRTLFIGNGDFYLGGISSIRASKDNIQNIENINWIYKLNPVTFNYRKKDEEGNYTDDIYEDINYGLIAEDTAPIADFLINYNDKEDGSKEMVGIEYMRLITPMLKAIQEQNQIITNLEARIKQLENK